MNGPPKHRPTPARAGPPKHYPKNLDKQFASDPFCGRYVVGGSLDRRHTPLGLLIEIWWWFKTHRTDCGPAFAPIATSVEACLRRECPEEVEFLEKSDAEN